MSTGQQPQVASESLTEESVELYLREHPAFFEHRAQLLALMKLTHPTTGETISLIERQVAVLRDQNRSLKHKLMELVEIARENEQLSKQLHAFSNELLKTRSLSDVIAVTQDKVRELFDTDFVTLRLFEGITDDQELSISSNLNESLFKDLLESDKPVCGRIREDQIDILFESNALEVASAAIIPLKAVDTMGLLALASRDPQRFNPSMGYLFLSHLGDLVSSAIAVHLH